MINDVVIYDDERIDDLQCKGYKLIQKPQGFCFGMDAVLLANYAKTKKGQRVLDLCTGSGVIPILMAAKSEADTYVGLELQEAYADMAMRSVKYNHLENRVSIIQADLKDIRDIYDANTFSVVTVNPPYMINQHGLKNEFEPKTIARHEVTVTLDDVVSAASHVLKQNGYFYMIHKPFRLAEIFRVMKEYHIEPKRMRMVQPYQDKEPTMVLVEGVKGAKERIIVEPPLIVYKDVNEYTDEIYQIYGMSDKLSDA